MIECVPNFSEGRDHATIAALQEAVQSVAGAYLLDTHIDADHNRSVLTFAGEPGAVAEAAVRVIRVAAERIDLRTHTGTHPRIGAADVVPFVPLGDATLAECAALAHQVGARVAGEIGLPVYFYGAAATRPERHELPNLRRGQYEGLRERIATDPASAPDVGPAQLGSAGAVVIGARLPLIAYNIYLNTADVTVAERVARAVRGSSGGLRGVRALGMLVNGQAQVSMNLTDYRTTPLHRAVQMVEREAAVYGASITASELVGLIPEGALDAAACTLLRLHDFTPDRVLERRIVAMQAASQPLWAQVAATLHTALANQHPADADALASAVRMAASSQQDVQQQGRNALHQIANRHASADSVVGALALALRTIGEHG